MGLVIRHRRAFDSLASIWTRLCLRLSRPLNEFPVRDSMCPMLRIVEMSSRCFLRVKCLFKKDDLVSRQSGALLWFAFQRLANCEQEDSTFAFCVR